MHKRTHKWAFPLGLVIVLLAIVGAVYLAGLAGQGIAEQIKNPKERLRYEEFLAKIIVHDPDPFDAPNRVPEGNVSQLLDISIWSILSKADPKRIETDEGSLVIQQATVDAEYQALFGVLPPAHMTIEGADFDFEYRPVEKEYLVPLTGALTLYSPRVTNIAKTGNAVELTVDYLAYEDYALDARGRPVEPLRAAKVMIITLYEQENGSLQVGSIRQPTGAQAAPGETKLGPIAEPTSEPASTTVAPTSASTSAPATSR